MSGVLLLRAAAEAIIAATDRLSEADRAIGDGDHGIGMRRGFEAALVALDARPEASLPDAARAMGMAVMSATGGASGAVFGTLFQAGARGLEGRAGPLDGAGLAAFLEAALAGVMKRGGASEGQKTMLDALAPAARAARASAAEGLAAALEAAARAAAAGVEVSRDMVATTGKARALGERSLGYPDPGAISVSVLLAAMRDRHKDSAE